MSQYLPLSTQNVEFILELFDAGASLHQILDAFYKKGQVGVQYVTIQRCLVEHGRVLPSTPTTQHATPQTGLSQHGAVFNPLAQSLAQQLYGSNLANPPLGQPSPGQIASIYNPTTQVTTLTTPNSAPTYPWNVQAEDFAMSAHRAGKSVSEIYTQLRNNGYDHITPEEVMASLRRQGVYHMKW